MPLLKLTQAARELVGLELSADQERAFERYVEELVTWNKSRANLTAITEPLAVEMRHFLDSLSVLRVMPLAPGLKVIDVGTGAGFPGLPLRIIYPALHLTLLEATGKKIAFLEHLLKTLNFNNIRLVHARAEEAGQNP